MAAITLTNVRYTVWGDKTVILANAATVADDDTLDVPGKNLMGKVEQCLVTSDEAVVIEPNINESTGVITFNVSSGTPDIILTLIGS